VPEYVPDSQEEIRSQLWQELDRAASLLREQAKPFVSLVDLNARIPLGHHLSAISKPDLQADIMPTMTNAGHLQRIMERHTNLTSLNHNGTATRAFNGQVAQLDYIISDVKMTDAAVGPLHIAGTLDDTGAVVGGLLGSDHALLWQHFNLEHLSCKAPDGHGVHHLRLSALNDPATAEQFRTSLTPKLKDWAGLVCYGMANLSSTTEELSAEAWQSLAAIKLHSVEASVGRFWAHPRRVKSVTAQNAEAMHAARQSKSAYRIAGGWQNAQRKKDARTAAAATRDDNDGWLKRSIARRASLATEIADKVAHGEADGWRDLKKLTNKASPTTPCTAPLEALRTHFESTTAQKSVYNTEHEVTFRHHGPGRASSSSVATRITTSLRTARGGRSTTTRCITSSPSSTPAATPSSRRRWTCSSTASHKAGSPTVC